MSNNDKKIIYLSGAITAIGEDEARRRFSIATEVLKSYHPEANIISPLDNGLPTTAKWSEHMIADLQTLNECTHIYSIGDISHSIGSQIEILFANRSGIEIIRPIKIIDDRIKRK